MSNEANPEEPGYWQDEYKYTGYTFQLEDWPKQSEWKCEMFGMGASFTLWPTEGNVPNAFWRWMQYVCFGNKWTKANKK